MKYLIVDLNIKLDGHKYGFVDNLIQFAGKNRTKDRFVFLVNNHPDADFDNPYENVAVINLSNDEQKKINSQSSMILKAEAEWRVIEKYLKQEICDRLVLLELDLYQVSIGRRQSDFPISGIWFRPYKRMLPEDNTISKKINHLKVITQKKLALKWALRNKALKSIFILNDNKMPDWHNKKGNPRFFMLPDPHFDYPMLENYNLRELYNIPKDNLIFLQFGYIDERKNIENILLAFNKLSESVAKKSTLLIIGKFAPNIKELINSLQKETYQLIVRDEFIPDSEMQSTFSQTDVILRMNINYFGSSGIIGIAARHNKPVIASNNGIMAELVEAYQLGQLVDPYNVGEIKKAISYFHSNKSARVVDGSEYSKDHTLVKFAETLLSI